MNKITKLLFSALPLCALTVLTSCDGNVVTIDDAVANQRVMAAVEQMTTGRMDSFEIDVVADVDYLGKVYDVSSVLTDTREVNAAGELHVKVNDLFEDTAKASVLASASLYAAENEEVLVDVEASAAVYLDAGWLYADLTEIADLLTFVGADVPEVLTLKTEVGNLAEAWEVDPSAPAALPLDVDAMLPYVEAIEGIEATETNGELTVVYTVTMDDVASVFLLIAAQSGEIDLTGLSEEELAQYHAQALAYVSEFLDITTARITLGVSAEGYINKLYFAVDIAVTTSGEDDGVVVNELEASLHIDISNLNKVVDVVLPDNLDDYTAINQD